MQIFQINADFSDQCRFFIYCGTCDLCPHPKSPLTALLVHVIELGNNMIHYFESFGSYYFNHHSELENYGLSCKTIQTAANRKTVAQVSCWSLC